MPLQLENHCPRLRMQAERAVLRTCLRRGHLLNSWTSDFFRYFGPEAPYIIDAKQTGNLGRYLNHSCTPNLMVQNVFVDTHDLRFPWVAFFANRHVSFLSLWSVFFFIQRITTDVNEYQFVTRQISLDKPTNRNVRRDLCKHRWLCDNFPKKVSVVVVSSAASFT